MSEQRIVAGGNHTFPPGTVNHAMAIENRHNVQGPIQYQIGLQPQVTVPVGPNEPSITIDARGLQLTVWNGLPNSVYCVW